jgi:hypothetical protein
MLSPPWRNWFLQRRLIKETSSGMTPAWKTITPCAAGHDGRPQTPADSTTQASRGLILGCSFVFQVVLSLSLSDIVFLFSMFYCLWTRSLW